MPKFSQNGPAAFQQLPTLADIKRIAAARQAAAPPASSSAYTPVVWASGSVLTDGCFGTYLNFLSQFPEYRGRGYGGNTQSPDNDAALAAFGNRFPLCASWAAQAAIQRNAFQQAQAQTNGGGGSPPAADACVVPTGTFDPAAWNAAHPGCPPLPVPPPGGGMTSHPGNPPANPPTQNVLDVVAAQPAGITTAEAILGAAVVGGLVWWLTKDKKK